MAEVVDVEEDQIFQVYSYCPLIVFDGETPENDPLEVMGLRLTWIVDGGLCLG